MKTTPPKGMPWSAPVLVRKDGKKLAVELAAGRRRPEGGTGRRAQFHQAARGRNSDMGRQERRLFLAEGYEMKVDVQESASPRELLVLDSEKHENRIAEHPIWRAALEGSMPKGRLKKLLLAFYPVVAGPGRYAFAAKVSQIDPHDGKQLSCRSTIAEEPSGRWGSQLEEGAGRARRDPARARGQGFGRGRRPGGRVARAWAALKAGARRGHRLHARAPLPPLWSRLADSLQKHYGVKAAVLQRLRFEAGRAESSEAWVKHLVGKYVVNADASVMFEARRSAREALWAWTALTETV